MIWLYFESMRVRFGSIVNVKYHYKNKIWMIFGTAGVTLVCSRWHKTKAEKRFSLFDTLMRHISHINHYFEIHKFCRLSDTAELCQFHKIIIWRKNRVQIWCTNRRFFIILNSAKKLISMHAHNCNEWGLLISSLPYNFLVIFIIHTRHISNTESI